MVLCSWGFPFALAAFILVICISVDRSLCVLITNHRVLALSFSLGRAVGQSSQLPRGSPGSILRTRPLSSNSPQSSEMVSWPEPISFVHGLSGGSRPHQTTAVRNKTFQRDQIEGRLTTNVNGRRVQFVAFVLHGFLDYRAKSLIVCILRRVAMTPNHLFASFDSNQPLRLRRIPQDFHSVGPHDVLHLQPTRLFFAGYHVGAREGLMVGNDYLSRSAGWQHWQGGSQSHRTRIAPVGVIFAAVLLTPIPF